MHLVAAHGRDAELWTTALARFRQADIYYTPEYARAYEGFSEGKAYAFVLTEGDAAVIHPVMIRDIAVLPFARAPVRGSGDATPRCDLITPYGYGGPLASAEDPQARERLLSEFDRGFHDMCRTLGAVSEFVRFHPLLETQSGMGERLDLTRRGETVWLSITADEDAMMAAMSPAGRNKIRRARREGVTVSAESGLEAIRVLTSLYHETLGRLGAPRSYYFPEEYFERIAGLPGESSEILIARRGNRPLWAGVFMRSGEFLHYHLSGTAGQDRTPGVNNLALLAASLSGAARGAKTFHLGGGFGSREDSLFAFKASIGNRRSAFWTGQRVLDRSAYESLTRARNAMGGGSAAMDGNYFPAYRAP